MPHNRFYFPSQLKKNQSITIKDDELKHFKVMRLSKGDICEVVNGKNQLATAKIEDIQKKLITLTIKNVKTKKHPSICILCIALLKPKKLELILEKGTELSVTEFWIFTSDNSEIKDMKKSSYKRFEKILISSIKQCGRLDLPKIKFYKAISELSDFNGMKFYGDTSKNAIPFKNSIKKDSPKLFVIGPEMGFSEKEITYLKKSNIAGVKLAEFILRTETAAIAAAVLMSHSSLEILP